MSVELPVSEIEILRRLTANTHTQEHLREHLVVEGDYAYWARKVGPGGVFSRRRDPEDRERQKILRAAVQTLGGKGYITTPKSDLARAALISHEGSAAYHQSRTPVTS